MPLSPTYKYPIHVNVAKRDMLNKHLNDHLLDVVDDVTITYGIRCAVVIAQDINMAQLTYSLLVDCSSFDVYVQSSHFTNVYFIVVTYKV